MARKKQLTAAEAQHVRLTDWTWRKYREAATDQLKQERLGDLVQLYLPWVGRLARHITRGISSPAAGIEDLVQVGSVGLVQSIERFDPDRGASFTTFARTRVTGAMRDYLRVVSHLSRSHHAAISRGESPPVRVGSLGTGMDIASSPQPAAGMQASEFWWEATRGCRPTERLTVFGKYRDHLPMAAIGRYLGLSESRISQIHHQAVQQIQERHTRQELADELPDRN